MVRSAIVTNIFDCDKVFFFCVTFFTYWLKLSEFPLNLWDSHWFKFRVYFKFDIGKLCSFEKLWSTHWSFDDNNGLFRFYEKFGLGKGLLLFLILSPASAPEADGAHLVARSPTDLALPREGFTCAEAPQEGSSGRRKRALLILPTLNTTGPSRRPLSLWLRF